MEEEEAKQNLESKIHLYGLAFLLSLLQLKLGVYQTQNIHAQ